MTAGPRTSFIVLLLTLLTSFPAVAGDYLNSAHGNTSYGVNRLGSPYVAGNCAHCHEQHASIDGNEPSPVTDGTPTKHALFTTAYTSATDNFCVECHDGTTRVANTAIINHSYSYRAGGLTTDFASSIKDIFDLDSLDIASTHNLDDIKTLLSSAAIGIPWGYSSTSHPCEGCHNPHAVQGDPANSDTGRKTAGNRGYPLSRPSQHRPLSGWGVWGDDSTERMSTYAAAGRYQAPYYDGSTSNHEPENTTTDDGSNLTDINTFCTDCHNATNAIYSTTLGRPLYKFNWSIEMHGKGSALDLPAKTECQPPFIDSNQGSYILACTDCHEAHGSPNIFLIRPRVNNNAVSLPVGTTYWGELCGSCHAATSDLRAFHHQANDGYACTDCHESGKGPQVNNCTGCHFHGSYNSTYRLF
ncbi:cytochrome c3 family protein [uncultured Desulfuromonas sp.]|uniref:cytochrome c3 family protein n=1 Tax=uncultured Desulfuromonas sp. TaxID=181013 RepID=UPI002AAADF6C|nr:cytochrome c3 family protein [uncultured Desulfuromonas sp.]